MNTERLNEIYNKFPKVNLEKVELSTLNQLSMFKSQVKEYINNVEKIGKEIEKETDRLYDVFASAGTSIRNMEAAKKEIEKQIKALGIKNHPDIKEVDDIIKQYNKVFNKYK